MAHLNANTEYTQKSLHTTYSLDNLQIDLNLEKTKKSEFIIENYDDGSFLVVKFKPDLINISYSSANNTAIKVNGVKNYRDPAQKILDYVVSSEVMLDLTLKDIKPKK